MPLFHHQARLAGTTGGQRVVVDFHISGGKTEEDARRQPMIVNRLKQAVLAAAEDAGIRLDLEE